MYATARLSILLGAGLLTAVVSAGPALAANSANQPPPRGTNTTVVGLFRSRSDCNWAGRLGDAQNRWDNPRCDQANETMLRGWWRLTVDHYGTVNSGGWPGDGNGGNGGNGNGGNGNDGNGGNGNGNGDGGNGHGNGDGSGHGGHGGGR